MKSRNTPNTLVVRGFSPIGSVRRWVSAGRHVGVQFGPRRGPVTWRVCRTTQAIPCLSEFYVALPALPFGLVSSLDVKPKVVSSSAIMAWAAGDCRRLLRVAM